MKGGIIPGINKPTYVDFDELYELLKSNNQFKQLRITKQRTKPAKKAV